MAYVLHVPQIMIPKRLPLFCLRNVGRVGGNIYAKADLPKHVVFVNRTLMSVNYAVSLKFNQVSHICSAQLHLQPTFLSEVSICTIMAKQYKRSEWINLFYGYALATNRHCLNQKFDRARLARSIDTSNGSFFVLFNYLGQLYCPPYVHLPLETRRFKYSFYYQQNSQWNFTENHQKYVSAN